MGSLRATILSMNKAFRESVLVADFGEFGSITKHDISEYSQGKMLSPEEILEIIHSMLQAVESQDFNSLNLDQKA